MLKLKYSISLFILITCTSYNLFSMNIKNKKSIFDIINESINTNNIKIFDDYINRPVWGQDKKVLRLVTKNGQTPLEYVSRLMQDMHSRKKKYDKSSNPISTYIDWTGEPGFGRSGMSTRSIGDNDDDNPENLYQQLDIAQKILMILIDLNKDNINNIKISKEPLIVYFYNFPEILKYLLDLGVNPDATNSKGQTALMKIVLNNELILTSSLELLLNSGASVDINDIYGQNIFDYFNNYQIDNVIQNIILKFVETKRKNTQNAISNLLPPEIIKICTEYY